MAKKTDSRTMPPAADPEAREKQLVNLAVDLAEKQLRDGTAPASVINHYLKLASSRESMEREILSKQAQLITAKAEAIQNSKTSELVAQQALDAMKTYGKTAE